VVQDVALPSQSQKVIEVFMVSVVSGIPRVYRGE
jgi:hypothetical protein